MTDVVSTPEPGACYLPLEGKTVLLGVSGGIAAYKAADYARRLRALGARVIPVLTDGATRFVSPLTFAALTGEKAYVDLFASEDAAEIPHITLAKKADAFVVLPATANILAKAAHGIADDLLSTLLLAFRKPVLFFPAMNAAMYEHPATQANLRTLMQMGQVVVEPAEGPMACGDVGRGRLVDWPVVREAVLGAVSAKSLEGLRILVTAGPTREPMDPVRYLSNRSSGKMGYAVASVAARRGAKVLLVSGPVCLPPPAGCDFRGVTTAQEMAEAVLAAAPGADIVVMAAAVADYRPSSAPEQKIKKGAPEMTLPLVQTRDILSALGESRRPGQFLVGFCAETEELGPRAIEKQKRKNVDLMVGNDVSQPDAGFDVATNRVIFVAGGEVVETVPLLSKEAVAERLWDRVEKGLGTSSRN